VKQFKCGDVVPGCQWVTRSEDEKELFEAIHSHARDAHGMDEVPPEVVEAIHGVITEVDASGPDTGNAPDSRNVSTASVHGASSSP
jgi:predicted small metal-binding protein